MNYKRGILMKIHLVCVLIGAALLQTKAAVYGQLINVSAKNISFKELIQKIERQSSYRFVYEDELIRSMRAQDVSFEQKDVREVLSTSIGDLPIQYEIIDNTIILKKGANQQQTKEIVGFVFDKEGAPVHNATVRVKGTFRASATNAQGRFAIGVLPGDKYIEISMLGYHTKELSVSSNLSHIILDAVQYALDESVVTVQTGYRALTDAQLTGAVSNINQKDYDQRVAVSGNFLENLEGKLAGLVYNPQSNDLSIRGVSTFDAVRKPLIVLDGFPTEIDIQSINPNDIVSVNVLKDAAAASIYGSRASNGVIVIETRRGKMGETKFNLRATTAIQPRPDFDYMNYASSSMLTSILKDNLLMDETAVRSGYTGRLLATTPVYDAVFDYKEGKITQAELDARVTALGNFDNLQQYKKLFYRNALTNQVDFDLSGGSDKHTYLLGANYLGERGDYVETDNKRILLNFASTHHLNRLMHLDFKGIYRNGKNNTPYRRVGINDFQSYERLVDDYGNALPVAWGVNPYGGGSSIYHSIIPSNNDLNIEKGLYDQLYYPYADIFRANIGRNTSAVRFQARLNTKITSWLDFDFGGAYEDERNLVNTLQQENYIDMRRLMNYRATKDPASGLAVFNKIPKGDLLSRNNESIKSYTVRGQFNFNYTSPSKDHQLSGVVGSEIRRIENSSYLTSIFGYDGQTLIYTPIDFVAFASSSKPVFDTTLPNTSIPAVVYQNYFGENYDDRRFVSFYGDGTYLYKNRYALTGSIRTDQSNLFGTDPQYRYKPFYSLGANWSMHQEEFMKDLNWISLLKFRTAYGVNGNTPTSANGKYLILNSNINYTYSPFEKFYDVLSPENSSMRWERTSTFNIGLDFALWKYRLSGSLDYYYKNSTDVIGLLSSDPTSGFNGYNANTATIVNNGFEMQVTSSNIQQSGFSWKTQLTGSFNFNKVKEVLTAQPTGNAALLPLISQVQYTAGQPIGALYAYNYAGLNEKGQPEIIDKKGVRRMVSTAGSGSNSEITIDDMLYMGTTTPKYVTGLNNQFSLGQFDLSFLFMYYGGHVMRTQAPDPNVTNRSFMEEALNYWKKPGDEATTDIPGFAEIGTPNYFNTYAKTGYTYANKFVKKADFIRLRDIVVTYRLKEDFANKFKLSNAMLRFQVQNPLKYTFSDNGIDPDAIERTTGKRSLPRQAMYSISLYTNF
ncbi:SusC/RagA family TonB-linked outer membrane protein [Sphingobacterium tabacisoli]|uniref:SusC/RagA family TonB-linked outer membrane protein n=1 Tax=Sphingobacterium tabacisoli TaxID=2044855 RepID=A0ABW5L1B9_9SPHI|nr:SusC/RagA family TonB-linked outer membrane protein [Sphingobacterium tabacisoli]